MNILKINTLKCKDLVTFVSCPKEKSNITYFFPAKIGKHENGKILAKYFAIVLVSYIHIFADEGSFDSKNLL